MCELITTLREMDLGITTNSLFVVFSDPKFTSGTFVKGNLYFNPQYICDIGCIIFNLIGEENVTIPYEKNDFSIPRAYEHLRKRHFNQTDSHTNTNTFHLFHSYQLLLSGFEIKSLNLHSIPFSIPLSTDIPPSFIAYCPEGFCSISYRLEVYFKLSNGISFPKAPAKFNFDVVPPASIPFHLLPASSSNDESTTYLCCLNKGSVKSEIHLPTTIIRANEPIEVVVSIHNNSNQQLTNVCINVYSFLTLRSPQLNKIVRKVKCIGTTEIGLVPKMSSVEERRVFLQPSTTELALPTNFNNNVNTNKDKQAIRLISHDIRIALEFYKPSFKNQSNLLVERVDAYSNSSTSLFGFLKKNELVGASLPIDLLPCSNPQTHFLNSHLYFPALPAGLSEKDLVNEACRISQHPFEGFHSLVERNALRLNLEEIDKKQKVNLYFKPGEAEELRTTTSGEPQNNNKVNHMHEEQNNLADIKKIDSIFSLKNIQDAKKIDVDILESKELNPYFFDTPSIVDFRPSKFDANNDHNASTLYSPSYHKDDIVLPTGINDKMNFNEYGQRQNIDDEIAFLHDHLLEAHPMTSSDRFTINRPSYFY